ncbi:hypothetical protein QJS10_CPA09g01185 [Acorus calamus]|uniref:DUF4283 domain-containing protein n=1 Tax=Acorus calamus TaxID=4465 RepID=A0AAV9E4B2_ACOCL|nr:hypothetical protein QJS10_CPA09g01185 [Acorus calamus]
MMATSEISVDEAATLAAVVERFCEEAVTAESPKKGRVDKAGAREDLPEKGKERMGEEAVTKGFFVCKSTPRRTLSSGGSPTSTGGPSPKPPPPPPPRVKVEWSPEILDRARSLGKSVVASWEGGHELHGEDLLDHLKGRWKGLPFGTIWKCGRRKFFVHLPTWAARDLILMESMLHVEGGVISFSKSDFSDMGVGGCQWQVLLRGLPVVWRTEGVLCKVVEPLGYLLNYVEILECEEISPPVKVTVWVMKEASPPPLLEVVLGGMEIKIQVEVVHSARTRSYAETVKFGPTVATRWVPVGGGPGVGVAGTFAGVPGAAPAAETRSGEGSGGRSAELQLDSRPEAVADVASSGVPPGCQSVKKDGGYVSSSDELSAGHVDGSSLERKVACSFASEGGRVGSIRGRQSLFCASSVAEGRREEQRDEGRRDVSVPFKRQVAGFFKSHGVTTMQKSKLKSIILSNLVQTVDSSPFLWDAAVNTTPRAGVSVSPGELRNAESVVLREEEAVRSVMEPGLQLVPFSEATEDHNDLGSPLLREGPRPVVVESGAAEFLGSPGCVKASQIGVNLQNEGERFQFKSFLYKSRDDSSVNIPRRYQQGNHS